MDDATIISKLRNRGYPTDIADSAIIDIISDSLEYAIETYTDVAFGTFTTVANQQVYDLFGVGKPLEGGENIIDLFLTPFEDLGETSPFGIAPFLQYFGIPSINQGPGFDFNRMSDMLLWDINWESYYDRFGSLRFEPVSVARQAPVRVIPTPSSATSILARYAKRRTEDDFRNERPEDFLLIVEAKCCEVLARIFSATAGIKIGTHGDSGLTMKYWQDQAAKKLDKVNDTFPYLQSYSAVART